MSTSEIYVRESDGKRFVLLDKYYPVNGEKIHAYQLEPINDNPTPEMPIDTCARDSPNEFDFPGRLRVLENKVQWLMKSMQLKIWQVK